MVGTVDVEGSSVSEAGVPSYFLTSAANLEEI